MTTLRKWLRDLDQDVRHGYRTLRRNPTFTIVAVITLAVGIGANTAIFSVVHAVLLNPLPFANADRLVQLYENVPAEETPNQQPRRFGGIDVRELIEVKARSRTLSHVIGQSGAVVSLTGGADIMQRKLTSLSAATFPMLGVQPMLGRAFTPEDERAGNDRIIMLSYGAWQRYFGANPQVLGETLAFNGNVFSIGVALGVDYTIVGVMPSDFHFPDDETQFWTPLALTPPADGRTRRVAMMARLADGASVEAAETEVSAIVRDVRGQTEGTPAPSAAARRFELVSPQDEIGAPVRPALLVLTAAVGFVLLIACANVASLLLARTAAREREIAVRIAIGAGRGRLIRQLLTEAVLLSFAGGVAGTLLAAGGVQLFRGLATDLGRVDLMGLGGAFPRLSAMGINIQVFVFALAVSVGTGLLFGLVPALRHARGSQMDVLRGAPGVGGGHGLRGRSGAHRLLVVAEIALATVLFVGGGLLIHSFLKLTSVDPGYDPTNVLTFQVSLPGTERPVPERKAFAEDLVTRLQAVPGVQTAGYGNQLPMVTLENSMPLGMGPAQPGQPPSSDSPDVRLVSEDFLRAMGVRVVAGRGFDDRDGAGAPRVLLINRTLARRDFADRDPIGMTVYTGRDVVPWTVIGVVDDVRQRRLDIEARPQFFVNLEQWPGPGVPVFPAGAYYAVRTSIDPTSVVTHIRDIVGQMDPQASMESIATMERIVANDVTRPRMYAVLLGLFAAVAVALAAAGIYGLMAYTVSQRTREIGIRMALGARRFEVVDLVLRQSLALTALGIVLGLAASAVVTRYLEGMLFGVTPLDPATFLAVSVFFAAVAALAAYLPARRATKVDPLVALRCE